MSVILIWYGCGTIPELVPGPTRHSTVPGSQGDARMRMYRAVFNSLAPGNWASQYVALIWNGEFFKHTVLVADIILGVSCGIARWLCPKTLSIISSSQVILASWGTKPSFGSLLTKTYTWHMCQPLLVLTQGSFCVCGQPMRDHVTV